MPLNITQKNITGKRWYLEGSSGSGRNYTIPIDKNPFLIGRSKECHLILSSKEVSRRHAKIISRGADLYLCDLQSTNGTFKNKVRITTEVRITDGDIIHFGDVKFDVCTSESKEDTSPGTLAGEADSTREDDFARYFELSQREKEILFLLLEGKSTKDIADKLFITDGTAKNHVLKIFKKTNTHSRVTLVNKFNAFAPAKD